MRSNNILLFFLFLKLSFFSFAQEESNCSEITNKKAIKYYEMGMDRKKYDIKERTDFLEDALALEPDYVDAYYALAINAVKAAKVRAASLNPVESNFLQVISICPQYHSLPYFYLGQIYLGNKEYEKATQYLKQFLEFPDDDVPKLPKDYQEKFKQAKDDYEYAKFYADIYSHPVPFNPNITKQVSTKDDEYLPLLSPDNELIFFTRRFVNEKKIQTSSIQSDKLEIIERFTMSKAIDENVFEVGNPLSDPFNTMDNFNYGGATISIDNKHLFLTVCKPVSMGYINCDIFSSDWTYQYIESNNTTIGYWSELKDLGDNINTRDGWESQPSLSADGKTLYFASAREDSRGVDIYKSEKDSNGVWQKAVNLGEPINTEYNDKSPFIHSDSKTLYFSSQGHRGLGGFDVFYSKMNDNGNWSTPVNIGYPINSENDEHGFVVSTDGKSVYFSSDKLKGEEGGKLDIFSFELYKEARPDQVLLLKGQIKDEQGKVVKDAKIELKNVQSKTVSKIPIDTVDGKYAAIVAMKKNEDIVMTVKTKNSAFDARLFSAKDTTKETIRKVDIEIKPITVQKTYKLNDIYYTTNSTELTRESLYILDEFIEFLKENTTIRIAIHGYTDNIGSDDDNLALSSDRAYSVLAYLQEHGIPKFRLQFKGFGETQAIATNDTEEGRALNRRTEFVILSK